MKKLFSFIAAAFVAVAVSAAPYTLTFKGSGTVGSSDSSDAYTTESALTDVFVDATNVSGIAEISKVYAARTTDAGVNCGVKFGTSSVVGTVTINLANPSEVDSVVVRAALYSDTEGADGFTVNGGAAQTLSAGNKVFENKVVTLEGTVSAITIAQVKAAKGRFYLQSITVYPKEAAGSTMPAAPVPTWPANQVKSLYSDTYDFAPASLGSYNEGWWEAPVLAEEEIGGNHMLHYTGIKNGMIGWAFANTVMVGMEKVHFDIYAPNAGSLEFGIICTDANGGANHEPTFPVTLEANQWNSFDFDVPADFNLADVFQCKIVNYAATMTDGFYVDNVFFYRTTAPAADTEAPTAFSASVVEGTVGYTGATITAVATDNSGAVTFEVYEGENKLAEESAASAAAKSIVVKGLTSGAAHTLTIKVKDASGNYAAAEQTVTFTTVALPVPAAVPTKAAADVKAIYSNVYSPVLTWHVGGWGQSTQTEDVDLGNGHALNCTNANYLGWEFEGDYKDFSDMDSIHFAVYTAEAGSIEFTPIWGGEQVKQFTLVAGWNYINVPLDEWAGINKANIYQLKWANMPSACFIANVYFSKVAAPAAENVTIYCQVDAQWWLNDGADVAVYCYKDGAAYGLAYPGKRMDKVEGATNVWTAEVPADLDGMIFVRCNPVTADPVAYNWNAKTADLTLPTDGKNLYTITTDNYCWASDECLCAGEWSVYGAAANEVAYELNGGATNAYGWTKPSEMFHDFMVDAGVAEPISLEEYLTYPEKLGAPGICAALTNAAPALTTEKWAWLKAYIESVHAAQAGDGASALPADGTGAAWRYAVGAFFIDGQRTGWPKSADFTTCGVSSLAAYQSFWKGSFINPTTVEETTTLWTPYLEGSTFDGWYANADFSGDKVVTIDATTSGTLYAHFIEYIPTIAEVVAMEQNVTTKAKGVVNYVSGKNLYIQDATGAILIYLSANPDAAVVAGKEVVISGTKTLYGGAPELKDASVVSVSEGTPLPVVTKTLAELLAEPLKYFGQCVRVEGVKLVKYDSYNNPFVAEGLDTVQCYKMVLEPADYPVGAKVNVNAIAGYYNKFQFIGDAAGIELASAAKKDTYAYPAREDGAFTLTNKWIYSSVEDNFSENLPGPADNVRGMAAKDGKMYFINRSNASITVVDGKTGYMLDPIFITGEHLFEAETLNEEGAPTGEYAAAVTLPFNDIKFDNAGNCLIGACVSGGQHFMVYKVDLTTGAATLVVDEKLYDNAEFGAALQDQATAWRFDAFGVYGDVNSHAIIMGADANSFNVYKWTIENGVAGTAEQIDASLDPTSDASLLIVNGAVSVTAFGTAPQVFPVDEDYFYVDGWSTLPMLYDMDGTLAEDFINCPTGVAIANNPGDTCVMNQGHNGLCEFQVGEEYFIVMAATNTVGAPTSAFALYKYADAAKSFADMEPLWYFPANGMGALTNGCRTAVPSVEVNGTEATIYLYTNNNGYAVYTFTGREHAPVKDALENIETVNAEKIIENGQLYIIKNGVRYTVLGARVK